MDGYVYAVLEYVVQATSSDLILFFVIVAVVAVPFSIISAKRRKQDKEHELKREGLLMDVVKGNTTIMSELKITLENSKADTKQTLERIHAILENQGQTITTVSNDLARINTKFDVSIAGQTEIASKVNKVLLIVDASPHASTKNTNQKEITP